MHELIHDIALAILGAWILGVAAQFARQPVFLAYLVAGFVIGPNGTGLVTSRESIGTIAELGLIFLLFMIGLEIDLKKIVRAGSAILVTAAVQIVGGCALGIAFFLLIGLPMGGQRWDALYLAVGAALSSTVIIVKLLYEKRELDTLPGRITLGVLVIQDVFVILFLALQPSLDNLQIGVAAMSAIRVAALVAAALLISRFVLPYLFHSVARLPELVLVGALAWCFAVGELAVYLDLSREMGALVAGVALSTFPYALDVTAKVTGLRDFFVTLFFVAVGMTIPVPTLGVVGTALVIAAFTVISRLLTVIPPLYMMKHGLRASLLPAINLAQLSEFSLVLIQLGVASQHVPAETASAVSLAFVLLAVLSTFVIVRSDPLTRAAVAGLKRIGIRDLDHKPASGAEPAGDAAHGTPVMLLGFFRTASSLFAELESRKTALQDQVSVIDFSPAVHAALTQRGFKMQYGDISNRDILEHAGIAHAKIIVSTVHDSLLKGTSNAKLVRDARALNPTATIIATAEVLDEVGRLYEAGADYVVVGRLAEANELLDAINAAEAGLIADKRAELDARLAQRREVLP
jgi:Kef-type K+ transport system membrane component KefB